MTTQAAIYYAPDGYLPGKQIMGRQAAGEGFLRAAVNTQTNTLTCYTPHKQDAQKFLQQAQHWGFRGQMHWISTRTPQKLADNGCLYLPAPGLVDFAWQRATAGHQSYSICGITHTTASHNAMSAITQMLTAPVQPWDALICTSQVVKDTVRFLLDQQKEYLRTDLGAVRFNEPQLPVIPLGVHCEDYIFSTDEKIQARQALNIAEDDIVFLFVGRLSFHAKAHPLQMYTALQKVSGLKKIHLVQCGWFANEHLQAAFVDGARTLCPDVTLHYLNGTELESRRQAWACADIFISLSDNIQETFGLTPIEAMAAGLPVIVSDWNGYKDTVRHDIDGFRIPTLMPPAPLGEIFAQSHDTQELSYDMYCGYTSQMISLDPIALYQACEQLVQNSELRQRMGAAGQQQAKMYLDWSVIYRRYQDLWSELNIQRSISKKSIIHQQRPDRCDPFAAFSTYPTSLLSSDHQVTLLIEDMAIIHQRGQLAMNHFSQPLHPSTERIEKIISIFKNNPHINIKELVTQLNSEHPAAALRGLLWLAKMEILRIHRENI